MYSRQIHVAQILAELCSVLKHTNPQAECGWLKRRLWKISIVFFPSQGTEKKCGLVYFILIPHLLRGGKKYPLFI